MWKSFYILLVILVVVILRVASVSAAENDRRNLDIILPFDHSYSMFENNDARMYEAQVATVKFIDQLDPAYDKVSLIRFS